MTDPMQGIVTDLPTIQNIADRPTANNPMLKALLEQAQALAEIRKWAADAQRLVAAAPADEPVPDQGTNGEPPIDMAAHQGTAKRQA